MALSGNHSSAEDSHPDWQAGVSYPSSSTLKHYYANGRRLATRDREGLKFYHVDHPSLPSGQAWAAPAGSPTRGAARSGSSGMTRGDTPRRRGARARRR